MLMSQAWAAKWLFEVEASSSKVQLVVVAGEEFPYFSTAVVSVALAESPVGGLHA